VPSNDEVGKHYGDLSAFGGIVRRDTRCGRNSRPRRALFEAILFGYRAEQLTPMTE
jgi:hypothetical protein